MALLDPATDQVRVAVRVRPMNKRENDLNTKCVVQMQDKQTVLNAPKDDKLPKTFAFDNCFNSVDPSSSEFASQENVFESIGENVVENAFAGYNACIFAYGQTGSGKSYTMMGTPTDPGLIPRLCDRIFEQIGEKTDEMTSFKVEVSYMEIYNEKVHDLLDPKNSSKRPLKVREHKVLGPTVDGLCVLAVGSFEQITRLMDEGNKCRTVAATNMNAESSRSHAVFTLQITQTITDVTNSFHGEKVSKISLVDLAGSERAQKTGAMGKRLEEGGNINKSLTTLGMVISALAEKNTQKKAFVPYRDSVLTWLLKDNLGGNSKTVMIATISPSADNYEETLSTLRYADRAKKIVNHAVVNEDPNAKIIRELREEVETLRLQINHNQERQNEAAELRERLAESERLVEMMNKSWEERLRETEVLRQERMRDFAEIGISVADAGIKVEKDRFYLVNLNADPSLNELLVYYINQKAVIGSAESTDSELKVDFLLQGLGINPHHAVLEIINEDDKPKLYIELLTDSSRVCVNGVLIEYKKKALLRNGDRLLIGHNHFFRVNCPRDLDESNASQMSTSMCSNNVDYNRAWMEANSEEKNPIGSAVDQYIEHIAIKHEEEKQAALEKQYEEFERYLQGLGHSLQTPSTPMTPAVPYLPTPSATLPPIMFPGTTRTDKTQFLNWANRREELLKESLTHLKTEIVRANALVREANMIAAELWGERRGLAHYDVTLQIPAGNLRPSKIKAGNTVCEPVIVVKRYGMSGYHLWTLEQLENKLVDMRDMYNERRLLGSEVHDACEASCSSSSGVVSGEEGPENDIEPAFVDSLFESQEKHSLIGVANVFMGVLFHDLKLDYPVTIISQQGEACGKLLVEVYRIPESSIEDTIENQVNMRMSDNPNSLIGQTIKCRIRIKKAINLPPELSHCVFCQYSFFNVNEMLVVAPKIIEDAKGRNKMSNTFVFDYEKDFNVTISEEFLEYVQEDALSIEIWGHRTSGLDDGEDAADLGISVTSLPNDTAAVMAQKQKSLQERWSEVTRRIELFVDIKELNENGEFISVDVFDEGEDPTGGVYQLKQGLQRRLSVRLRQSTEKGGLPLVFSDISTVAVGSLVLKEPYCQCDDRPLDSYQEEGLDQIREQWSRALDDRQKYLSEQIKKIEALGTNKTQADSERESSLIHQWMLLTEERQAVSVPPPNSSIPGATADWIPPPGIEQHVPVVFLNISADEFDNEEVENEGPGTKVAGLSATLSMEKFDQMVLLPLVEKDPHEMSVTCSWDSSLHQDQLLNKVPQNGELIYGIVRVAVRLSYPFNAELVIRKRICLNVYKKTSFKDRLMKKIGVQGTVNGTGVYYDIVAHVPKSSLDMEDRASLAMMAARHADEQKTTINGQCAYVEAYTKSIQAVECMLKLDRLRQENAVANSLGKAERKKYQATSFRMKRTVSLPSTISNMALPPIAPKQSSDATLASQNQENNNNVTVHNKLMEVSTSSSSSGYSSMARPTFLNLKTSKRFPQSNFILYSQLFGLSDCRTVDKALWNR
uniref:Kinesin motor domain-containing protein n=1 Tax=Bursaphelenchus xylophilus TaxID=6326 RepID=A0A1I7SLJ5_BURXY